jgi:hypothetical protein
MRTANLPTQLLATVALTATFGCASSPKMQVRAVTPPIASSPSLEQGIALLRSGNVAMAIETLRIAARQDPGSKRALNALGVAYDRLGRFDLSRSYYEQALALAPADADILHNLSVSLRMQGRIAEAEEVAQEEQSRRLATTEQHADAAPQSMPALAPSGTPSVLAAGGGTAVEPEQQQLEKVASPSQPPAPVRAARPGFAVRGASIDVALPPPMIARVRVEPSARIAVAEPSATIASVNVAPLVQATVAQRRPAIASVAYASIAQRAETIPATANIRRSTAVGLRVVNCVGRRGMARRIAGAIANNGFGGAELLDDMRQCPRTVLILPQWVPAQFSAALRALDLRPVVIHNSNVKFATLVLGADAVALDQQLVRSRRA